MLHSVLFIIVPNQNKMKILSKLSLLLLLLFSARLFSQPWVQNDAIFNPSGVPSLPFSQPRFADMDGDGDFDMWIGNLNEAPVFMENVGDATSPSFAPGPTIFSGINPLDAEMGVCYDLNNDGLLDLITGGFTGLNFFQNVGSVNQAAFEKLDNFFSGLTVGNSPVPDLADIDNDGDADLVVGLSESGLVKLYTNTGNATAASFSESLVTEIGDVGLYAYPTFCDLDADLDQDLLVGRDSHGFIFYENTGDVSQPQWEANSQLFDGIGTETYWNSPGLADLNGDGTFDLVFGTASGPLQYFVNTGSPSIASWEANTSLFGGVIDVGGASNPCFYDYDNDGDLDMFTGSQMGDIKYFQNTGTSSGPAWEENSGAFSSLKHSIYSAVAVGDVNDDGLADAIVGDLSGKLYYHRNTGFGFTLVSEALQSIALGGWTSPRLLDYDVDGDFDIVVGNEDGQINYIENQGSATSPAWVLIPGFFTGVAPGSNAVPALVDLDFDGDLDMLCGKLSGAVRYYENQNGNWVEDAFVMGGIETDQNSTPAFADLDGDGDPDLILGQYDGTFSYYENRNIILQIPQVDAAGEAFSADIYPNPVSNSATIRFHVKQPTDILLEIYSAFGTKVTELKVKNQLPGAHQYDWDASSAGQGLYLIKITASGQTKVLKLLKTE
jgi:hypothetical protein